MSKESDQFFNEVVRKLVEMGQTPALTADERDIVDDYEQQGFGAMECARHISKNRR